MWVSAYLITKQGHGLPDLVALPHRLLRRHVPQEHPVAGRLELAALGGELLRRELPERRAGDDAVRELLRLLVPPCAHQRLQKLP